MNTTKRILSILLTALLLFSCVATGASVLPALAANDELAGEDYNLKLMIPDIMSFQGSEQLQWYYAPNLVLYPNLTEVYLARNEREACQVYFYEKGDGRDLRLEVAPYVNAGGDVLPHEIFNEHFFTITQQRADPVAEALVPYGGETVHVDPETCATFYVELRAAKDQTPGVYNSTYTLYDGDEVIRAVDVTATVWNFAIPEAHYSTMVGGLYNSNSGYGSTKGFLEQSGIRFNGNEIIEEDKAEAERILEGWQAFLLDHGVTCYEMPRFLIDNDAKEAKLTAADPRRKAVAVPLFKSGTNVTVKGQSVIAQYQALVGDSDYLADKMYFYPADEPGWTSDEEAATTTALVGNIKALWPDAHVVIPINSYSAYAYQGPKIRELTDIFCPNQVMLNGHQDVFDDFTDGSWHRTWRYLCNDHTGCITSQNYNCLALGVGLRAPFWQAEALGSNGLLNWNIGYVPYQNGKPYDIWGTQSIYPKMNGAGTNGEAIIVFESKSLGLDPATPIASLRLKHVNDAQDDYDYLELAKEAFGTGADSPYTRALNKVFQYYTSKGSKYIFSAEKSAWPDGGSYEWRRHYAMDFVDARLILGNALSEAWTTDEAMHQFGDWRTEVEPDATHNGLQIRTCATCGAEESRKLDPVTGCTHSFDTYTPVDADSHSAVCTLCGETVTLPHTAGAAAQENVVNATCTAAGSYDEVIRCAACGYEISRTAKTNALLPHTFGTWVNEQAATCDATGVKGHYQCSVCKKYFDADKNELADLTIPKDDSNHAGPTEIRNQKAASCSEEGYTGDTVCTACGNTVAAGETIPKAAHQWNAGTVTTEPTCTAAGVKTFECANCTETRTETIPASGHSWNSGTVTTQPTCTAAGVKTFQCNNCTETKTEPVAALGHAWGDWVITKQPTCTQEGQQTRTCTRDSSHKDIQPIAKKPHTDNGSGYCRDCGADLKAGERCKYCGEIHTGPFGWLIKFFHSILAIFKR